MGGYLLRLGGSCCPCWSLGRGTLTGGARSGGAGDWIFAFGRCLVLSVSRGQVSNEDKKLIKRTASEEAILAKRPRRKTNKNSGSTDQPSTSSEVSLAHSINNPLAPPLPDGPGGPNGGGGPCPGFDTDDDTSKSSESMATSSIAALPPTHQEISTAASESPSARMERKRRSRRDQVWHQMLFLCLLYQSH